MVVEASCNGMECEGNDYEKKICSREEELADQVRALLDENESLEKNQCPSEDRKKKINSVSFTFISSIQKCSKLLKTFFQYFSSCRWKVDDVRDSQMQGMS